MTFADLRALVERMTPGPWRDSRPAKLVRIREADANGFATLRTLAPALLDVVEAAQYLASLRGDTTEGDRADLVAALAALDRAMESVASPGAR